MPSARATALTQQHRAEIGRVATLASRQAATVARGANTDDIDGWWDTSAAAALLRIVTLGFSSTVTLAARWLRQHAAAEGAAVAPVQAAPDLEQMRTSLRVTGPVAFKTSMRSTGDVGVALRSMEAQLRGSAQRLTLAGDRETTQRTVDRSRAIVGYRRVLSSKPCAFCAMLASRGAVYKEISATNVVGRAGTPRGTQPIGSAFHDNCTCTSEPLYEREPEPADVLDLRKLWDSSTAGRGGADALKAFRQAWDKQQRSAPPAAPPDDDTDTDRQPGQEAAEAPGEPSPPEQYPGGLTEKGAQEWMEERWGEDEIGKRAILFQGLGRDAANEMAETIHDLFTRYPNTAKRIRVLGASAPVTRAVNARGGPRLRNISGRAYADAARQIGSLRVSGPKARKSADLKAMLTRDVQTGWHPPGTDSLAAVIRHEFGHFMYWEAQDRGGVGPPNRELEDAIVKATGMERGTAEFFRARYDVQREQVSRYATTNGDELMAEAFAYVTSSDEPSQLASDFVEVLVRYAEG